MKVLVLFFYLLSTRLCAGEVILVDAHSNMNMASIETTKQFVEMEFADGNFGNVSFLCEYLEKRNVDEPKYKLLWAASQNRIGNWTKAEKLYLGVINHKKSTNRQKSLACVYLSKQQINSKDKEAYANMAVSYSKNDLVIEMISEIYRDLQIDAISKSDSKKAEYYKQKYLEFMKDSLLEKKHETEMGDF